MKLKIRPDIHKRFCAIVTQVDATVEARPAEKLGITSSYRWWHRRYPNADGSFTNEDDPSWAAARRD